MDKLKRLLARCKCGVFITVNEHRTYYESVESYLKRHTENTDCPPQIKDEVRAQMIARDTVIQIQFYPDTPIGSYDVWHYDLDAALDDCLSCE